MNYLVLGSAGQIGSPLCNYLKSQGHNVFGFDILNFKFLWTRKFLGNEYLNFSEPNYIHSIGSMSYFQVDWRFLD